MWPDDLAAIMGKVNDTQFGGKPWFAHEVIDLGDGAIRVSEFPLTHFVPTPSPARCRSSSL
jgi:hypothetical protein